MRVERIPAQVREILGREAEAELAHLRLEAREGRRVTIKDDSALSPNYRAEVRQQAREAQRLLATMSEMSGADLQLLVDAVAAWKLVWRLGQVDRERLLAAVDTAEELTKRACAPVAAAQKAARQQG